MESQDTLLSLIQNGQIVEGLTVPLEFSIDEILDARDSEEFAVPWMSAYKCVESRQNVTGQIQSDLSARIRELAYLRAFARWKSSDLAAYISDDFGLIADAAALGIDEPWIEELLRKYKGGEIPGTPSGKNGAGTIQ